MTDAKTFSDVKSRLREAISSDRDTVTISRSDAERIEKSWFPRDDKLPTGHCCFDASLVPFLAAAIDHNCYRYFDIGGISIIPHLLGGVYLLASNGIVACIAYDPEGKVTEGGMRLMLPKAVLDLCKKKPPIEFESCGAVYKNELPDWCQLGHVTVLGGVAMIFPKSTPPDIDLEEGETPLIWSAYAETSNLYQGHDFRIGKPFNFSAVLSRYGKQSAPARFGVGTAAMARVMDAMKASGVEFWDTHPRETLTAFFPAPTPNPRIEIILTNAGKTEQFLSPESGLPEWLSEFSWNYPSDQTTAGAG